MAGKITAYLDCVSPYSYFALVYLEKNRGVLEAHGVDIDIIPVFLGGINVGSGNKPPWTLPAKGAYSKYDSERAKRYFGLDNVKTPPFFPILSLLPQRALGFIKEVYSQLFTTAFTDVYEAMWQQGKDVSKPDVLAETLRKRFSDEDVCKILDGANSPAYKQRLNDSTKAALDHGAFGCPWFWVRNFRGEEEPFFGSDRFHFMWEYLGLPWNDIGLEGPRKAKSKI